MDRCYILHAKTVASPAIQIAGARKFGFKADELTSEFGSHRVYIDRRVPGQMVGPWLVKMIGQTSPGDVIHLWDLSLLGGKDGIIADRLSEIAAQEASVKIMSTGMLIRPTADAIATMTAMRQAREVRNKKSSAVMMKAKRKSGMLGGAKPRFTREDWDRAREVWRFAKTQPEFTLMVKEALGKPMSYATAFRRSKGDEKTRRPPWPERGSGKRPRLKMPKKRKRRRTK